MTSCGIDPNTHDAIVDIKVTVMNTQDGTVTTIPLHDEMEEVDKSHDPCNNFKEMSITDNTAEHDATTSTYLPDKLYVESQPDDGQCSGVRLTGGNNHNKMDSTDQPIIST